ncbi:MULTISPECIES: hypothetical protein [Photobacterium]|uniref:Shikimate kinase n=1 Tax=Photobacterium ganghwense TaxID=320778 RepID=A0A0J1H9D7_9GAMM|nr:MULTISPECIES: hypothetical protein [Photobacterium]KLV08313.1 hypothetical protein ABT57_16160 [Photobacterium ganghwense]PSU07449.1 hypothetical protein C9I92_17195 [Photobacterium ganghwense]
MKVVWLHGPPAAGKLTVAKKLSEDFGYKLFHNHLTVDLSLSIYDAFGEKDFCEFTNQIRRIVLAKAQALGVTHLVMTSMTCSESDAQEIQKYLAFFIKQGIDVYPIHLNPVHKALYKRVMSEERADSHKLSCQHSLEKVLTKMAFKGIEHKNTLSIDNTDLSENEVAQLIVEHVG